MLFKKRKKNIIILTTFLFFSLAACNSSNEPTTTTSEDGTTITHLDALINKHPLTKDLNEMQWLQDLEDANNVDVTWQQISADWDQQKAPMLASGDIPDLMFFAVNDADYTTYTGLFQDLTELIETDGPNIQRMFEEKPETKILATAGDGAIYATPKYQRFWPETVSTMFINKSWLDNLGLDTPTTWEELHDVLLAFKNEDANGNGDSTDEIPMDFYGRNEWSPMNLLGSTGLQLTSLGLDGYFAENAEVKNYYTDDRYKDLMIYLNQLYADGLINPEAFTADYSTYQSVSRGIDGVSKVGFTFGWEVTDRFGNDLADEYIPIKPLTTEKYSDVEPRWLNSSYQLNMDRNRVSMDSQTANKEVAMQFLDAFYEPEISLQVLFGGIADGCIEKHDDGSYTILPPADPSIDPGSWKWQNSFADNGPIFLSDSMDVNLGTDMINVLGEKALYADSLSLVDRTKDELLMSFLNMTPEDINTSELNRVSFMNISDQYWADFIINGNVEDKWDEYVNQLQNAGIYQNNEIIQKYYDEYLATLN